MPSFFQHSSSTSLPSVRFLDCLDSSDSSASLSVTDLADFFECSEPEYQSVSPDPSNQPPESYTNEYTQAYHSQIAQIHDLTRFLLYSVYQRASQGHPESFWRSMLSPDNSGHLITERSMTSNISYVYSSTEGDLISHSQGVDEGPFCVSQSGLLSSCDGHPSTELSTLDELRSDLSSELSPPYDGHPLVESPIHYGLIGLDHSFLNRATNKGLRDIQPMISGESRTSKAFQETQSSSHNRRPILSSDRAADSIAEYYSNLTRTRVKSCVLTSTGSISENFLWRSRIVSLALAQLAQRCSSAVGEAAEQEILNGEY